MHVLHFALHNSFITNANYKCKILTNTFQQRQKYKPKLLTDTSHLCKKYKHKVPSSCASWWRGLLTLTHWWNPLPHASLAKHTALHNWPLPLYIPHNKYWHTFNARVYFKIHCIIGCQAPWGLVELDLRLQVQLIFWWYEEEIEIVLIRRYQRVIGAVNSTMACISSPRA